MIPTTLKRLISGSFKMKIYWFWCFPILLCSCSAPVNLSYDNGKTIPKGNLEILGSYSDYNTGEGLNWSSNYGARICYGITDNYNLKFRYERINMDYLLEDVVKIPDFLDDYFKDRINYDLNYFEIENKLKLRHANVSFGLPLSYYSYPEIHNGYFEFDPRIYLTLFRGTNIVELNLVPKCHFVFVQNFYAMPGISVGLGLSNNLDRWAIRPEIGWDGYFSYGIGLSVSVGNLMNSSSEKNK